MGRAMVDHDCESFRRLPRRIVLDVDDTLDVVHGVQQLRLFSACNDESGFQPIPCPPPARGSRYVIQSPTNVWATAR